MSPFHGTTEGTYPARVPSSVRCADPGGTFGDGTLVGTGRPPSFEFGRIGRLHSSFILTRLLGLKMLIYIEPFIVGY